MTSPNPPAPHQPTEPGAQSALQQQQQARLAHLFRQSTERPEDQYLHVLISRYRRELPA